MKIVSPKTFIVSLKIISSSVLPKLFSRSLSMVVEVWYHGF